MAAVTFLSRRISFGVTSPQFVWGRRHEYWTTYVVGPLYMLIGHSKKYWNAYEVEMAALSDED